MPFLGHVQKARYRVVHTAMSTYGREARFAQNQVAELWHQHISDLQGRADSPRTNSKSCCDKLAVASCTSLLNSLLSSLINPSSCYLDYLVVPRSAYHEEGFSRAFEERLIALASLTYPPGYRLQKFQTLTTDLVIPPTLIPPTASASKTTPTASASIISVQGRPAETILGGVKMGSKFPPNARGASCLSRARMAEDFVRLLYDGTSTLESELSSETTYGELKRRVGKRSERFRSSVKQGLGEWAYGGSLDSHFTVPAPHQRSRLPPHHPVAESSPPSEQQPEEPSSRPRERRGA